LIAQGVVFFAFMESFFMVGTIHLCTREEFPDFRSRWHVLTWGLRFPMITHEWHAAALQALLPEDTPYIVMVLGPFGELRGVAPLVRLNKSNNLGFLSSIAIPEPAGMLADSPASLQSLLAGVRDLGFPLELERIPIELWNPEVMQDALGVMSLKSIREEGGSPWVALGTSWEEFEQGITSKRRGDLNRAYRQANRSGGIAVEFLRAGEHEPSELLRRFIQVESMSWKSSEASTIRDKEHIHAFFDHLVNHYPGIVFGFLSIGGKLAAGQISVIHSQSLWVLKIAFDEAFRKCSPGILLMHEMLRYAHTERIQSFEFLGYEENWIKIWTKMSRRYYTLSLYPYSQRGLTRLGKDVVANLKTRYGRCSLSESGERG